MSIDLHNTAIARSCTLAQALANSLVENGRTNPEQRGLASALTNATRTMVDLIDVDEPTGSYAEQVEDLASTSVQILADAINLSDDGYNLSDVKAQLDVAGFIVEALDKVVGSSILSGDVFEWLSDQMHAQLTPFLRLAVRLSDPDKFDCSYVPDAWVQSGATAMGLAARLSRVIATADAKDREQRATSGLAA